MDGVGADMDVESVVVWVIDVVCDSLPVMVDDMDVEPDWVLLWVSEYVPLLDMVVEKLPPERVAVAGSEWLVDIVDDREMVDDRVTDLEEVGDSQGVWKLWVPDRVSVVDMVDDSRWVDEIVPTLSEAVPINVLDVVIGRESVIGSDILSVIPNVTVSVEHFRCCR